jgi:hypothetical protein
VNRAASDTGTPLRAPEAPPPLLPDGGLIVLSYYFPPMSVGPSIILDRLLSQFDLADSLVFAGKPDRYSSHRDRFGAASVEVRRRDVPSWWPREDGAIMVLGRRVPVRLRALGNLLVAVRVALEAARALRAESARGLLAVYPKQHFLLASCLSAMLTRKPLFVYFFDVFVEGLPHGRRVARVIEQYVGRRATVVFTMSDAHRVHVEKRLRSYGVRAPRVVELPHAYLPSEVPAVEAPSGKPSIVFTGAIYDAQADAIARLVEALDSPLLVGLDPRLHLVSQTAERAVAGYGIRTGGRVTLRSASSGAALGLQRASDILFLPLAWSAKVHVIRTAAPSKLPEYLAAGRPILVHAPPASYIARYARQHGFAEVVTDSESEAVAAALHRLATDDVRCAELVVNARRTLERHHPAAVAATFRGAIADAAATSAARAPAEG